MTRSILIPAVLASLSLTASAAQAGSVGAPLTACYDHVAIACDATSRQAQSCAASGMSACEAVLSDPALRFPTLVRVDFEDPISQQPVIVFVHAGPAPVPAAPAARVAVTDPDPETAASADG